MNTPTLISSICIVSFGLLSCKKDPPENNGPQDQTVNLVTSDVIPSSIIFKEIPAQTFTMGSSSIEGSPSQQEANPEHEVTLSAYEMTETEITNEQYVEFLNSALANGAVEVKTADKGPETGQLVVVGTNKTYYSGKTFYSLEGIRVLKDHDDADVDENEFTGQIEPENPLNIAYIGFNSTTNQFYVKNPHDLNDFNWKDICNYQDYGSTPKVFEGPILNDFDDWAGAGKNLSNELEGWTEDNPSAATNLPTQAEVALWPVTFIKWYGAKAFADYYKLNLPTEAQWECAAKAGLNYTYAVHDGSDIDDAVWNTLGIDNVALGHVLDAKQGSANPYGLYNLAGNAWEWMADNYIEPLSTESVSNPLIEQEGSTLRSWRGGSWNYHQQTLQSSIRFSDQEVAGNDHFGFRIVRN